MRPSPGWIVTCALVLSPLAGCCIPFVSCCKPATCPPAREGFEAARPVIEALEVYRGQEGRYPERLAALVPAFLEEDPSWLTYEPGVPEPERYTLSFTYTGPGMNRCAYVPGQDWRCSGYY
jgi:hypothetical protein